MVKTGYTKNFTYLVLTECGILPLNARMLDFLVDLDRTAGPGGHSNTGMITGRQPSVMQEQEPVGLARGRGGFRPPDRSGEENKQSLGLKEGIQNKFNFRPTCCSLL